MMLLLGAGSVWGTKESAPGYWGSGIANGAPGEAEHLINLEDTQ